MKVSEMFPQTVPSEWASYIEPLVPLAAKMAPYMSEPDDAQARHEYYRALLAELVTAYMAVVHADARHPDWYPYTTTAWNGFLNNPDDDYYVTPVDDDGIYRISGFRGTVKTIDFQVGTGSFLQNGVPDEHLLGHTLANYDLDKHAAIGEDGSFDLVLSRERPDGWTGDWWELHEGATHILNRQISYDWENEADGRYGIERLDVPASRGRIPAAELEQRIKMIPAFIDGTMTMILEFMRLIRERIGVNRMDYWQLDDHLAIPTQAYVYGAFELEADEALVIEFQVPERVRYWSFHLGDDLGFMVDWMHHHTIINGHTAHVGQNRTCHVVVSATDPGVPNWLDTMGHRLGALSLRWEDVNAFPHGHTVTKVKTEAVREHLPPDTPEVTAAARDATIRRRRKGAQMRKRW
jgi:hypothetical protein